MIPGYKGNFSFAYCKGNILKCSNPGGELKMESLKNKSRALDILERDETNKLTDAGKEKTECRVASWPERLGPLGPPFFPVFGCTHAAGGGEGDSRQLYVCV